MRFGVQYLFRQGPAGSRRQGARFGEELAQARLAEELGFDDIWVGERHFSADGWLPSPLVAAAAVAAATTRVGIRTNAVLAALHQPVRLAEECAVVDAISGGRFTLGVALGSQERDFEVLGVPRRERAGRLEETVEILRRCWREDAFDFQGRYFAYANVSCYPKPVQASIPIWIGAERAASALHRAARLGDGWLASHPPRGEVRDTYIQALREANRSTENPPIAAATRLFTFASEDPERDAVWLRPLAREAVLPTGRRGDEAVVLSGGLTLDEMVDRLVLIAPPDEIVKEITAAHDAGSFSHHIHTPIVPGAPVERCNEALELFARDVIPRLRGLGEAQSPPEAAHEATS